MAEERNIKRVGKGSKLECLPSRFAMQTVTKGDTTERAMNNYAKKPKQPEFPAYGSMGAMGAMGAGYR